MEFSVDDTIQRRNIKPSKAIPDHSMCSRIARKITPVTTEWQGVGSGCAPSSLSHVCPQGCSSPIVVKFADTQKDKEQRRLQQQLAQQMQQLNTATWGNLTGLGGLTPQYLAVSAPERGLCMGPWRDRALRPRLAKATLSVPEFYFLHTESQKLGNQHQGRFELIKLIRVRMCLI